MNPDVIAELTATLPAPAETVLPPARQELRKVHLLAEIHSTSARPVRKPRLRLAIATAGALAIAAVITIHPWDRSAPVIEAAPGVVAFLNRASAAVGSAPAVRPDQFTYVETNARYTEYEGHSHTLQPAMVWQDWLSADGSKPGLQFTDGAKRQDLPTNTDPQLYNPTYEYLRALPTDPGALIHLIYAQTKGHGPDPDDEAFTTIGDLMIQTIVPPKLAAALFRAAERIPGVSVVGHTTDELGRSAVAVGRVGNHNGLRTEWLFDPTTYAYLGVNQVATKALPSDGLKPGDVTEATVIIRSGVVDNAGDLPGTTA